MKYYLVQINLIDLIYRLPSNVNLIHIGLYLITKNMLMLTRVSKCFAYNLGTLTGKIRNMRRLWYSSVKPSYFTRQWAAINSLRTSSKTKDWNFNIESIFKPPVLRNKQEICVQDKTSISDSNWFKLIQNIVAKLRIPIKTTWLKHFKNMPCTFSMY